jgi:glutathione S-transferase
MRLDGDQTRPAFRTVSPLGTVPVLVDGTGSKRLVIPESYAALVWLGERHERLLPRIPAARARTLMWLAAAATVVDPPIRRAYDEAFFTTRPARPVLSRAFDEIRDALDRVDRAVARQRQPFLAGASPTIADAGMVPSLWLLADLIDDYPRRLPRKRWPALHAWYDRTRARPDVAAVLAAGDAWEE